MQYRGEEAPVSVVDTPAVDEQLGTVDTGKIVRNWLQSATMVVEFVQEPHPDDL